MADWTTVYGLPCPLLADFSYSEDAGINRSTQGGRGWQAQWRRWSIFVKTYDLVFAMDTSKLQVAVELLCESVVGGILIPFIDHQDATWKSTDHKVRPVDNLDISLVKDDLWELRVKVESV